jgi:hypothetical protein
VNKWIKRGIGVALVAGLMLSGTVPALGVAAQAPQAPQSPVIKLPEPPPETLGGH